MLPGVLLHVVEPAMPIDRRVDFGSGDERLRGVVPDLALLVFGNLVDRDLQHCAGARGRRQSPSVKGLTATRRIKRRAIKRNLPERFPAGAGDEANIGNDRVEVGEKRVAVIEPVNHASAIVNTPSNARLPRWGRAVNPPGVRAGL